MRVFFRFAATAVLALFYALTIAPDLTWSHFSADGGDFIAAAATGGVPHPTGYPLYLLLAKAFQSLPVGSLAFRTNLLSAVCAVFASRILFDLIWDHLRSPRLRGALAMLGALAYGLAPAVWGQALVTEVYALHGLLIVAALYAFSKPDFPEWGRGLVFGLAASNHATSTLLVPLLFLYGGKRAIALRVAGLLSGLLLYLTLPLRALANPPVNWGDASTARGFFWLLSASLYRAGAFQTPFGEFIERLRAASGFAFYQFTALGLIVALYGLLSLRLSRFSVSTLWTFSIFLLFSAWYYSYDSHVYLTAAWLCLAAWIPIGAETLLGEFCPSRVAPPLALALILLLLARAFFILPQVDVSADKRAVQFIAAASEEIPPRSIVFVTGDEYVFSLWYAQFALGRRPDLTIVAEGLLQFEWYRKNLSVVYAGMTHIPDVPFSQPFELMRANPDLPVCFLRPEAEIKCLKGNSAPQR